MQKRLLTKTNIHLWQKLSTKRAQRKPPSAWWRPQDRPRQHHTQRRKLETLPEGRGRDQDAHSPPSLNMAWEVPATAIRQERETKGVRIWKEWVKRSLSADDVILYLENPKDTSKKTMRAHQNSVKLQDTKSIYSHLWYFYTLTTNSQKEKWRKPPHLQLRQKA